MNGHILVIDYNPDIREDIELEWAKYRYNLTWVNDCALAARELAGREKHYCLIAIKRELCGNLLGCLERRI